MAKRAGLATIVHDSYFGAAVLNGTESKRLRRSSTRHTDQIERQNWPFSRGFGSWGRAVVAVAIVERWPL